MDHDLRMERRRVRLFFACLRAISAELDIVGALLVHRQTRSEVLETLLPATVTLGGRAGALLSGVSLLLLAVGIARGKRIAFRLTVAVLIATIAFELVKDLDFEEASIFAWFLFVQWWFRHHLVAYSYPSRCGAAAGPRCRWWPPSGRQGPPAEPFLISCLTATGRTGSRPSTRSTSRLHTAS